MQVIVYRNLTRGNWSIATLKGRVGKGLKIGERDQVALTDVTFHVITGTADTIKAKFEATGERTRSVHAWCIGTLTDAPTAATEVTYNPYRRNDFHTRDGAKVTHADLVAFAADGKSYAINPT